jgi:hypothetical protein
VRDRSVEIGLMKRAPSERERYRTQERQRWMRRQTRGSRQAGRMWRRPSSYLTENKCIKYNCSVDIILHAAVSQAGFRIAVKIREFEIVLGQSVALH